MSVVQLLVFYVMSCLAGKSLLFRFKFLVNKPHNILLSPIAFCIFLTLALCVGVSLRLPFRYLSYFLWILSILLAFDGIFNSNKRDLYYYFLLLVFSCLSLVLILPYIVHGLTSYPGSPFSDKWLYIAKAQYLWDNPNYETIAASPFYQIGAFYPFRYASGALLAFFSTIASPSGEVIFVVGHYLGWLVFLYFTSTFYFGLSSKMLVNSTWVFLYPIITVISCWTLNIIIANNFDNLLALQILPTMAGYVASSDLNGRKDYIFLGSIFAFCFYVYFESSPVLLAGCNCLLFFALRFKQQQKYFLKIFCVSATIMLVLMLPAIADIKHMLMIQIQTVTGDWSSRPGTGYFINFFNPSLFSATYLGLYPPLEFDHFILPKILSTISSYTLILLAGLLLVGLYKILKYNQQSLVILLFILFSLQLFTLIFIKYDYGFYKFLILTWWLFCFYVVVGVISISARSYFFRCSLTTIVVVVFVVFTFWRVVVFQGLSFKNNISFYLPLRNFSNKIGSDYALINLSNLDNLPWVNYFLRKNKVALIGNDYYLFSAYFLKAIDKIYFFSKSNFVVSDNIDLFSDIKPIISSHVAFLYPLHRPKLLLDKVINPNGEEQLAAPPWYWLGNGTTIISFYSDYTGFAEFSAKAEPGPSATDPHRVSILLSKGHAFSSTIPVHNKMNILITIPVEIGYNQLALTPQAIQDGTTSKSNDTRELLIGISSFHFTPEAQVQR